MNIEKLPIGCYVKILDGYKNEYWYTDKSIKVIGQKTRSSKLDNLL